MAAFKAFEPAPAPTPEQVSDPLWIAKIDSRYTVMVAKVLAKHDELTEVMISPSSADGQVWLFVEDGEDVPPRATWMARLKKVGIL